MKIIAGLTLFIYSGFLFLGDPGTALLQTFRQREVITACLILEAGGEGAGGMQAVMNVIQNRAKGNPCGYYAETARPRQFSSLNNAPGFLFKDYSPIIAKAHGSKSWVIARSIVERAFAGSLPDLTGGATHYYALKIKKTPDWAPKLQETLTLKGHRFMKLARG